MTDAVEVLPVHEQYSAGYGTELVASFARRTVAREAAFFVPHLPRDARLLDCGCGPGSLSLGLSGLAIYPAPLQDSRR